MEPVSALVFLAISVVTTLLSYAESTFGSRADAELSKMNSNITKMRDLVNDIKNSGTLTSNDVNRVIKQIGNYVDEAEAAYVRISGNTSGYGRYDAVRKIPGYLKASNALNEAKKKLQQEYSKGINAKSSAVKNYYANKDSNSEKTNTPKVESPTSAISDGRNQSNVKRVSTWESGSITSNDNLESSQITEKGN